jgi:hypothetical protein
MPGWTNRGKYNQLGQYYRGETKPTNLYGFLATSAAAPTADTNLKSELTEIAAGHGYTVNDRALVMLKDISWIASGGPIPASGGGARWFNLTDDNATPANRNVYHYFDLTSDRSVVDGQTLTLQNCELRLTES